MRDMPSDWHRDGATDGTRPPLDRGDGRRRPDLRRPAAGAEDGLFLPWLIALLVLAFALRWGLALALPNTYRPDEVFQTLEPAYRLWSGAGVITWEWREGIRSTLFPGFLAALMSVSAGLGLGTAGYLPLIAAVLSFVSLSAVAVGFLLGWRHSGLTGAILCGALVALWPDLVLLGPKTLTEVQAGNLLIAAAGLAALTPPPAAGTEARAGLSARLPLIGVLLGFAFALRFHLAPALLLVAAWACRLDLRRRWLPLALGGALPVALLGLVDVLTWGSPFQSVWKNLQVNVVEGVSGREFGVQPSYFYLRKALTDWGAAVVPLGLLFLLGARRAPLLAATALVVVLSHTAIAHKEMSFIYAALPPAVIVSGLGTAEALRRLEARLWPPVRHARLTAVVAALWASACVAAAMGGGFRPYWTQQAAFLKVAAELRRHPDLCGLGLYGEEEFWVPLGGNVQLDRPVPIYWLRTPAAFAEASGALNYLVADHRAAGALPGLSVLRCWETTGGDDGGVCVARVEGSACRVPAPAYDLNSACRVPAPAYDLNKVPMLGRPGARRRADPTAWRPARAVPGQARVPVPRSADRGRPLERGGSYGSGAPEQRLPGPD